MARAFADRYLIVPCEASGCDDLAVIWDRQEEQVIDVIDTRYFPRYSAEDALWDEFRAPMLHETEFRLAA
jgi:hypothetical protein